MPNGRGRDPLCVRNGLCHKLCQWVCFLPAEGRWGRSCCNGVNIWGENCRIQAQFDARSSGNNGESSNTGPWSRLVPFPSTAKAMSGADLHILNDSESQQ